MEMECGCWDRKIQEEHRVLESQCEALKASLERPIPWRDRRVQISQILGSLDPALRLHLRREEETLFPAFDRLLGGSSGTVSLFRMQHDDLRALLDRLAPLLEDREGTPWQAVVETGEALVDLLEDHEERESRFITDMLGYVLKPKELTELARQFQHAASCGCKEES